MMSIKDIIDTISKCWPWFNKQKKWQKICIIIAIVLLAIGYYWGPILIEEYKNYVSPFKNHQVGVLILKLSGDTINNTFQRNLVCSLNSSLSEKYKHSNILIKAYDEGIDESKGIRTAHNKARKIGRKFRASIVLWGSIIEQSKFHPRITIVSDLQCAEIAKHRTLPSMMCNDFSMPDELINTPFYLAQFIAGYVYFYKGEFKKAIDQFENLLDKNTNNEKDVRAVRLHVGLSHSYAARFRFVDGKGEGWKLRIKHVMKSIHYFNMLQNNISKEKEPDIWANIECHKGNTYLFFLQDINVELVCLLANLFNAREDRNEKELNRLTDEFNLLKSNLIDMRGKSIESYISCLDVYTKYDYSLERATVNFFLGHSNKPFLFSDDKKPLYKRSIQYFEKALQDLPDSAPSCFRDNIMKELSQVKKEFSNS